MFKSIFLTFLWVIVYLASAADLFAQTQPNAGSLLQELKPAQPLPHNGNVILPRQADPVDPGNQPAMISVKRVHVLGLTAFPSDVLYSLVADLPGENRTLRQLQIAAARITAHYRRAGYTLARAYLPQQKMQDGIVTIEVPPASE